jgi:hypothetical protein
MIDEGAKRAMLAPIRMENEMRWLWRRFERAQDVNKAASRHILCHLVRSGSNETLPTQPVGRIIDPPLCAPQRRITPSAFAR